MDYYIAASSGSLETLSSLGKPTSEQLLWRNERGETPLFEWARSCRSTRDWIAGCILLAHWGWSLRDVDSMGSNVSHVITHWNDSIVSFLQKSHVDIRERNLLGHEPRQQPARALTIETLVDSTPSRDVPRDTPVRKRSRSMSQVDQTPLVLSSDIHLVLSSKILHDSGSFSFRTAESPSFKHPLVVKTSKWDDPTLHASLEREALMATFLHHEKIASFFGITSIETSQTALVYEKYDMDLERAISTCRKPSKEDRISMARDVLEGLAWIHALNHCHTALAPPHILCRVSYPLLVKVGFPKSCLISNVAYATQSTEEAFRRDLNQYAWIATCILYWDLVKESQTREWIDTYATRHKQARLFMTVLSSIDSFSSAVDLLRKINELVKR